MEIPWQKETVKQIKFYSLLAGVNTKQQQKLVAKVAHNKFSPRLFLAFKCLRMALWMVLFVGKLAICVFMALLNEKWCAPTYGI